MYVLANQFAVGQPGNGAHILIESFDGGKSWTRPRAITQATDTCFLVQFDGTSYRCVMDGIGGARDDLSSSPSLAVAGGAPDGTGTGFLYDAWVDGRDGAANPHVFLMWSTDGGKTWSSPITVEDQSGVGFGTDRPYYTAIAVSPDGQDLYLVYNAFTTGLLDNTTSPRGLVGVVLHAHIGSGGAPTNWSVLQRSPVGDPRGSSQNNLALEFLGDYVYADATNDYRVAVRNDVHNAADCPAVDAWRAAL